MLGRTVSTGGDVIVAIDGKPVNGADDVVRFVSFSLKPKDVAVLHDRQAGGPAAKGARSPSRSGRCRQVSPGAAGA